MKTGAALVALVSGLLAACRPSDSRPVALGPDSAVGRPAIAPPSPKSAATPQNDSSGRVPDSLLVLAGISLDDSMNQVARLLGSPTRTENEDARESVGYLFTTWHYAKLSVQFADSLVSRVRCGAPPCAMPIGIAVGTARSDVERALGPPSVPYPGAYDTATTGVYVGTGRPDCGISFEYSRGLVGAIILWCDFS